MELSREALTLTIKDMQSKLEAQASSIGQYKEAILDLERQKLELEVFVKDKDSKYDKASLKNNIAHLDVNIESIQKALFNMEELQKETNRMIAVLEVKRDAKR